MKIWELEKTSLTFYRIVIFKTVLVDFSSFKLQKGIQ